VARVELQETWITKSDAEAVHDALIRVVKRRRTQGSQILTRLLGGWFVPASWLPKQASIRFRLAADGVRVRASIEESMGFGLLDPILMRKYQGYFEQFVDDLREAVGRSSGTPDDEYDE
jgi:hypothetical protein